MGVMGSGSTTFLNTTLRPPVAANRDLLVQWRVRAPRPNQICTFRKGFVGFEIIYACRVWVHLWTQTAAKDTKNIISGCRKKGLGDKR